MDKNAIKKFAVWARRELIARVAQKAEQYGITEKSYGDIYADRVEGRLLSTTERNQRTALVLHIQQDSYQQVMEEVAYTWFNRFIALRFMEVNGYLPTRIRVFTNEENVFKPEILSEAIHMELDGLDMDKVYALKDRNQTEELYKYLLITQCNALSSVLPGMFQRISDYTELLFPDNLLREESVIEQMIALIPEEDWQDQVQIIGWLYQYYNSELKDETFALLKKNVKITKERVPSATQLFTPDWIVRYMVENSLGRLWVEGHPNTDLQANWSYYLPEAEQEPAVAAQLATIRQQYASMRPEDIKVIDPCMGSGHILVYLFDVLMQIYESQGYTQRDAAQLILQNNLYGLDIDARAAQLAYFAVMMKARQYDRRILTRGITPHVMAIAESNTLRTFDHLQGQLHLDKACVETANQLIRTFHDAKEYGSILDVDLPELQSADSLMEQLRTVNGDFELMAWLEEAEKLIPVLARQAEIMGQKYDVVVTNPPYMGGSGMGAKLGDYVKVNYPDSKSDLFAVFMEKCGEMAKPNGYQAMITQHAWMFLSSYEKLRLKLLQKDTVNMAHLGARAFEEIGGEVVQTTSFVLRMSHLHNYQSTYARLIEPTTQQGKEDMYLAGKNRYTAQQDNFAKIPGSPVAYWVSEKFSLSYSNPSISTVATTREGMTTANNELFVRFWHEVNYHRIGFGFARMDALESELKWFPYAKGGEYRKWYGNSWHVVDWQNDGYAIQHFTDDITGRIRSHNYNLDFIFNECLSWTRLTSSSFCIRYYPMGYLCDTAGAGLFTKQDILYILGWLSSKVVERMLQVQNPTIVVQAGDIARVPFAEGYIHQRIVDVLVNDNISLSRADWDAFETSWDFQTHPLIRNVSFSRAEMEEDRNHHIIDQNTVEEAFARWSNECYLRFNQLKANEEELNRIFIDIYGLQDELTPEVADKDVTVRKADLTRDIKGLISYAVGCMFGRYSLDVDGLAYAGGVWDDSKYVSYLPDKDGILPICDDEYFDDDIVGRFVSFIRTVYGEETLDENLRFIADALGGKGQPKEVIRNYLLNDFYADHLKTYQKRPIYWLFDSGKKNGFKCLIYMHRYAPDTIARIRTDYLHEQQSRYRTALADLERRIAPASTSEKVKLNKQLAALQAQAEEAHAYEEKIHHYADQMIAIDLDDGVKVNYAKFQDVLAKIK